MNQPTRTVKATTPEALLQVVPDLAGLEPERSLVAVVFSGPRSVGALRIDLPDTDDEVLLRRWASGVVGTICKVEAVTGVVPVAYTPRSFGPRGGPPAAAALRAVRRRALDAGLEVKDLLCVAADAWGSLLDDALPRGGRDLARIRPAAPRGPLRAGTVPRVPEAGAVAGAAFRASVDAWSSRGGPGAALHGVDVRPRRGGDPAIVRLASGPGLLRLADAMLEEHPEDGPGCGCLALLAVLAQWHGLRQVLLLRFAWGDELAADALAALLGGGPVDAGLPAAQALGGGPVRRPQPDRVETAIRVVLRAAGHLPVDDRGPLLAMAAWLHWALGAGTVAGRLAEQALGRCPDDVLARSVDGLVRSGRLPDWAFSADPALDPFRALG